MSKPDRKRELIDDLKTAARLFDGIIHGYNDEGITSVEFPTMLKAASFVEAAHLEQDAEIDILKREFNVPITVMFPLLAFAMCR